MRVLFIWHAALVPEYRERFRALRRVHPSLDLHVIIPSQSFEGGNWVAYEAHPDDDYMIHRPGSIWTTHPNGLFYKMGLRDLRALKPDIVHVHEEAWTLAALQMVLAFSPSVPIVIESFENLMRPIKWPFRYLESFVMRKAKGFVAVTPGVKRVLLNKGVQLPIAVIPYGTLVPDDIYPRKMEVPTRIAFVGRITREKGIETLLEAADQITSPFELIFVGNGPLAETVQSTRLRNGNGRVVWIAGIKPRDVLEFLKSVDILVLPSLTTPTWAEQFGRVLIEAMSVGTVPIGSSSGEIPWVIGDAGLVFSERDARELAAQIEFLIKEPAQWALLSCRSRERYQNTFTWEQSAGKLMEFYHSLLETH